MWKNTYQIVLKKWEKVGESGRKLVPLSYSLTQRP